MPAGKYDLAGYEWDYQQFFPTDLFYRITDLRVDSPDLVLDEARRRRRRERITRNGKLLILAIDHPGRRVTPCRDNPLRMGNRHEYLARAVRILMDDAFDGVMGTTDFIEDIILTNALRKQDGGTSFLDEKVIIGCMNRGGWAGVEGEIDDAFTCFTAESILKMNLDGGKMFFRVDPADPRSLIVIRDAAAAVTALSRAGLPAFVEPMTCKRHPDGRYEIMKDADNILKDAGAAAALGESAAGTWLKLQCCEELERVSRATTLPILMLGGPAGDTPEGTIRDFHRGMRSGGNIRGAMVGRNITFVKDDDPRAVAHAISAVIHEARTPEDAIDLLHETRGKDIDALTRFAP